MSFRHLRTVLRSAFGLLFLVVVLCPCPDALAVTRPGMSGAAHDAGEEPARIVPTPRPIASARPFQHYEGNLNELEVGLFDDAIDSQWDTHTLLEAALIAGGVQDADQLEKSADRFDAFVESFEGSVDADSPAELRAQELFEFMHREVLVGGYDLECTDLAQTLEKGRFNCVSSTVLFNCLAARFGLDAVGMELPGHAMSRIRLAGKNVDVETTCPSWFRLQDDPKRRAALIAETIGADLALLEVRGGREVSPVELVAMIYYNRGVDLLMDRRFAEAAAANAKALRLDPSSETARGNLLATLNNWAITIGADGKYERAIDLLEQGMKLDPGYETFTANYVHLYYRWAERLCAKDDFESALQTLDLADPQKFGGARLSQLRRSIYQSWSRRMIQNGKSRKAVQLLQAAEAAGRPVAGLLEQVENQALAEGNTAVSEGNRIDRGREGTDEALDRRPESKLLDSR